MKNPEFATPTITGPLDSPANKVKTAKALVDTVKGSADFVPGSELDEALTDFSNETGKLDTANQDVVKADLAADQARTAQTLSEKRWGVRKRGVLNAARLACDGSAQKMKALGFGVADPQDTALAVVPENLRRRGSKQAGVASVAWDGQDGVSTFMVQHATDPNDPTTLSAPKPSSAASFKLLGQTPGATVHFRVYALDPRLPTGQTDFCAWLPVKVSV